MARKKVDAAPMAFADFARELQSVLEEKQKTTFLNTGSVVLNHLWGAGLPLGKMIEIYSPEGLGKSTIALHICRAVCEQGYRAVYLDVEKALTESILEGVGVAPYDVNTGGELFARFNPTTYSDVEDILMGEEGDDKKKKKKGQGIIGMDKLALVVVDSSTFLMPSRIADERVEKVNIGVDARLMGTFCKKYKSLAYQYQFAMLFISQTRMKISMGYGPTYEDSATSKALRFAADIRMSMKFGGHLSRDDDSVYGVELNATMVKNKFREAHISGFLSILFGKGVSNLLAYSKYLHLCGAVKQSGAYFTISIPGEEDVRVQGYKGVDDYVKDNPDKVEKILRERGVL